MTSFMGYYPEALAGKMSFVNSTLLFTNVGAGWDNAMLERVISSMANFGEVFLDFTAVRLEARRGSRSSRAVEDYREVRTERWAERLPHVSSSVYLARFIFA